MHIWITVFIIILVLGFALWEIWVCEGAHLGKKVVVWMYDLAAHRYDRIKQFDPDWEKRFVGEPIAATVTGLPNPTILDVGAGTGRVGRALGPFAPPNLRLFAVEPSHRMRNLGRKFTQSAQTYWINAWSVPLPFPANTFDLVVSLEMLEFTPKPVESLREMVRVLRPGGWLFVTNRIGRQSPLILGHHFSPQAFQETLGKLGLDRIEVHPWQVEYDLIWANKLQPA